MAVFLGSPIPKVHIALYASNGVETIYQYLVECPGFKGNFDSLWNKIRNSVRDLNTGDGDQIMNFISNFDQYLKMLLQVTI